METGNGQQRTEGSLIYYLLES